MAGNADEMPTASTQIDELSIPMTSSTPPAGLAELYERHYATVFRAALRVTGNRSDAEDVLQIVFLRVAARPGDVEDVAMPAAYFKRAAVNAAVDVLRRRNDVVVAAKHEGPLDPQSLANYLATLVGGKA